MVTVFQILFSIQEEKISNKTIFTCTHPGFGGGGNSIMLVSEKMYIYRKYFMATKTEERNLETRVIE